jgi:phage terminase large subunit
MLATKTDPLWRIEPDGSLAFAPNTGQRTFIESPAHEILFSGHWGNGKSIALAMKVWTLSELYPGIRGVLLRKIYADLRISTLRHLRRVLGDALWFAGLVGGERPERFDFPNGSSIDFIGVAGESGRSDKLLSTEYGFIAADECNELSEGEWEMAMGRLRQPGIPIHQIFGCCNPDHPQHWLYHRFHPDLGTNRQWRDDPCDICRGAGERERPTIDDDTGEITLERWPCERCQGVKTEPKLIRECVVAGMNENDENQPSSYLAFKRNLRGTRRKRYFEGKWVAFEGQVYETFDPAVHVKDRPSTWAGGQPPIEWPRYLAIDFGYTAPFVCQWWARDPDRALWMYREIYKTKTLVSAHADEIHRLNEHEATVLKAAWLEAERAKYNEWQWAKVQEEVEASAPAPRFFGRFADHDAEGRATLVAKNIVTTAARKEKRVGIDAVLEALQPIDVDGQMRAGLYFIRDARVEMDDSLLGPPARPTNTIEEFGGYRWLKPKEGKGPKEETEPDNDHGMDAMRYLVYTLKAKGEGRIFGMRG